MNILDIIVIGIVLFFVMHCYIRGFAIAVYGFISFGVSIYLTNKLYPFVSKAIRENNGIFEQLKLAVKNTLGLSGAAEAATTKAELDVIAALDLPDFIKDTLVENNNPVIHGALNAAGVEDYIAGFIANALLNIASMISVFVIVFMLMKIIGMAIDILSRLPVINTVNKLFGAALGLAEGVIVAWAVLAALVWFFAASVEFPVNDYLQSSLVAKYFHETNFILKLVTNIFT